MFAGLITPADDKARMDARLYVEDDDAALRAAHHLDAAEFAIAKARAAVNNKSANAKALLDAVPAAAQHDPGYMFSRIQWLRHDDKIKEAAQLMLAAPRDPAKLDRSRSMVDRAAAGCAQTARSRRRQDRLPDRQRRRAAAERELPRRAAIHRRLDRAAIPARAGRCAAPFRPHRRGRRQSDHAGALVLLAGPRRPGARARARGARLLRGGGALSDRLLRPTGAGPAPSRRLDAARAAAARRAPPARTRPRIRNSLRHRPARHRRRHGGRHRRQVDRCRRAGDACRNHRAPQRRAGDAADRQDRAWPRLIRSRATRFRISACRITGRSGPRSSAASSTRSCARRARSTRKTSPARTRSA